MSYEIYANHYCKYVQFNSINMYLKYHLDPDPSNNGAGSCSKDFPKFCEMIFFII